MIILHFAPCGDVLALWGEKPVEDGSARPRRGRKPKGDPAGRLPYDAGDELLRSALATAGIAEKLPQSAAADLTDSQRTRLADVLGTVERDPLSD